VRLQAVAHFSLHYVSLFLAALCPVISQCSSTEPRDTHDRIVKPRHVTATTQGIHPQRNSWRQPCGQHSHADRSTRQTELDVAAHALSSQLTRSTDTSLVHPRSLATIPSENNVHSNRKHTRRYVPSAIFWPATTSNGFRVDGRSARCDVHRLGDGACMRCPTTIFSGRQRHRGGC
jgi:hypothetical protein